MSKAWVVQVIHPVGQRDGLGIGLIFAALFNAGVEIPKIGNRGEDVLAVQFEQDAQHAVRRRVLRAHVQNHRICRANRCFYRCHAYFLPRGILSLSFDRKIPAKRRSLKIVRQ